MDDRMIMDNLLAMTKSECDLMMHGSIEAPSPEVRRAFNQTLNDCLGTQSQIYLQMVQKGWYPTQQVEQQKVQQVKQKYSQSAQQGQNN